MQKQQSPTKPSPTRISVPSTVAGENWMPATSKVASGSRGGGGREGGQLLMASGAKGRGGGGGDGSGEKGSGGGGGEGSGERGEGGGGGCSAGEADIAPRGRQTALRLGSPQARKSCACADRTNPLLTAALTAAPDYLTPEGQAPARVSVLFFRRLSPLEFRPLFGFWAPAMQHMGAASNGGGGRMQGIASYKRRVPPPPS